MADNAGIISSGIIKGVENRIRQIDSMDVTTLKSLEKKIRELKADASVVLAAKEILTGKQKSAKVIERVSEAGIDTYDAVRGELVFTEEKKLRPDLKTGEMREYSVFSDQRLAAARLATVEAVGEETFNDARYTVLKDDASIARSRAAMNALQSVQQVIKARRNEDKARELELKKAKRIDMLELGKKLLAGAEVQQVVPPVIAK